jgi:hypothetical protein
MSWLLPIATRRQQQRITDEVYKLNMPTPHIDLSFPDSLEPRASRRKCQWRDGWYQVDPIPIAPVSGAPPPPHATGVTRSSSSSHIAGPEEHGRGTDNEEYIHHHATVLSITRPTTLLALRILVIATLALLAILAIGIVIIRRCQIPTSECFQDELLHRVNVGSKGRVVPAAKNTPASRMCQSIGMIWFGWRSEKARGGDGALPPRPSSPALSVGYRRAHRAWVGVTDLPSSEHPEVVTPAEPPSLALPKTPIAPPNLVR